MSQPNHKPKDDLVNDFDLWVGVIKNLNGRFFSIPLKQSLAKLPLRKGPSWD